MADPAPGDGMRTEGGAGMAMKYVVVRTPGGEAPVVFPTQLMHAYIARQLAPAEVVAAGFVTLNDGKVRCYGSSAGLHIAARGERDAMLIGDGLATST